VRYTFRCPTCALEFDVSRPVSEAGKSAACPVDGSTSERVFTMPNTNFNRPKPAYPASSGGGYSHSGHSHGPGTRPHTH
jgi:putative FmdB family regulatory protein